MGLGCKSWQGCPRKVRRLGVQPACSGQTGHSKLCLGARGSSPQLARCRQASILSSRPGRPPVPTYVISEGAKRGPQGFKPRAAVAHLAWHLLPRGSRQSPELLWIEWEPSLLAPLPLHPSISARRLPELWPGWLAGAAYLHLGWHKAPGKPWCPQGCQKPVTMLG